MAIDGDKIQANASTHKAMSYDRLRAKGRQLRDAVKELLAQAEAVDAAEDAECSETLPREDAPEPCRAHACHAALPSFSRLITI